MSRRISAELNIEAEVDRYLADDRKTNSILMEFPNISEIFFKLNTTLASSGPIERVYSQAALIHTL